MNKRLLDAQVIERLKIDEAEEVMFKHDLNAAVRKLRYLHTLEASAGDFNALKTVSVIMVKAIVNCYWCLY